MIHYSTNLEVRLKNRSYPIMIGRNLEEVLLNKKILLDNQGTKSVAIVDEGLLKKNPVFFSTFIDSIDVITIPAGENSKSINQLNKIWDFLAHQKMDRSGLIFAIGGGVVGDLGGFAAATFLRGVSLCQIPTTLLAMVDSSVGGKTGINLSAGKNLVGSFHQPSDVIMDLDVLKSLPSREFSAGMAEVIKYGMIGNKQLLLDLSEKQETYNPSGEKLAELIKLCCQAKAQIVEQDEREMEGIFGGRALLNLGHTFAHAIEAVAGYGDYLHGEAVGIGLLCALRLSLNYGMCKEKDEDMIRQLLVNYELPHFLRSPLLIDELIEVMKSDKKVHRGNLRFVLMREIGEAYIEENVDLSKVYEVWKSVGAE